MNIEYTGRDDRRWARIGFAVFAGAVVVGALPALTLGGPMWAVAFCVWVIGLFALVAGIVMLVASMSRVRIVFDESGLDVHVGPILYRGGWDGVAAINVEQVTDADAPSQELLVLWLTDDSLVKVPARFPVTGTGPKGHVLADVANLSHSSAEIQDALRRYAGGRFRSALA
jgi:hypothetical protein